MCDDVDTRWEDPDGDLPDYSIPLNYALALSLLVLIVISLPFWFMKKRKYLRLKKRSSILTMSITIGCIFWVICIPLREIIGHQTFSCGALDTLFLLHIPLVLNPIIIKVVSYQNKRYYSEIRVRLAIAQQLNQLPPGFKETHRTGDFKYFVRYTFQSILSFLQDVFIYVSSLCNSCRPRSSSTSRRKTIHSKSFSKIALDISRVSTVELAAVRFSRGWMFVLILFFLLLLPYLITLGIVSAQNIACFGCSISNESVIAVLVFVVLSAPIAFNYANYSETEMDPLRICYESYLALMFLLPPLILAFALHVSDPKRLMYGANQSVNWLWIEWFGLISSFVIQVPYQVWNARGVHHSQKARIGEKSNEPDLEELLTSAKLTAAFQKHLTAEFAVENLIFLLQVRHWKSTFDSTAEIERTRKAYEIFETFIPSHSPMQVNIPERGRKPLESKFANHKEAIEKSIFNFAENEVKNLLSTDCLPRFYKSAMYDEIVKEKESRDRNLGTTVVLKVAGMAGSKLNRVSSFRSSSTDTPEPAFGKSFTPTQPIIRTSNLESSNFGSLPKPRQEAKVDIADPI